MWITKDINLPDEIIAAQKNGELVIFAGAGISTPPPSNLPNFEQLAIDIAQGFIRYDSAMSIDTFLGKLHSRNIKVHEKAIELLTSPESKPNSYHINLIKLFSQSDLRIVTTNFDDHFKTAATDLDIPFYSAPALPLGRDFNGVVHLHGSVTKRPKDLVLVDSDFGRAYFTDGWATNFLRGLFSNYVVLFIGFSANDPVMKYIARGLGSNNRNRFAFTEKGHHDHWNHLQIKHIEYPRTRHDLLQEAVEAWVERTQMGLFEQRKLIKDIAEKPPEYNEVEDSFIGHQLNDNLGARHFFEFAKHYEWVEWMDNSKMLEPLFNNNGEITVFKHMQSRWFSSFLKTDSEKMFKTILEKNGISSLTQTYLVRQLRHSLHDLSPSLLGKWLPVVLGHVNFHNKEQNLDFLADEIKSIDQKETLLIMLEYLTRPITKYKRKFTLSEDNDEMVDIEIELQGDDYWLNAIWDNTIKNNLQYFAVPAMKIFINQLQMITYYLKATGHGEWDPINFSRSAIEPHDQDRYPDDIDFLINCCRDVIAYLIDTNPSLAEAGINQCFFSESKILRRISIHSYKLLINISADKKMEWLIKNDLLFNYDLKHEVFQFIKYLYKDLGAKSKKTLYAHIDERVQELQQDSRFKTETINYEQFNLYYWLTLSDGDCRIARRAFKNAKRQNKHFKIREDHPDFTHWMTTGGFNSISSKVTVEEVLSKDPNKQVDLYWLLNFEDKEYHFEKRDGFLEVVSSAIESNYQWGWNLLKRLASPRKNWKSDLWTAILNGLNGMVFNNVEWMELTGILLEHRNLKEIRYEVTTLLNNAVKHEANDFQHNTTDLIKLFHKVALLVDANDISSTNDAYTQAINHPAGKFTQFFCTLFFKLHNESPLHPALGLIKKNVFSKIVETTSRDMAWAELF
ncbi:hypothetical protein SD71_09705 [Cohnella kolymensis]|uniref:SIR2-like domain-containing protein n=1 Tax=Cohnella kolymensis TaxID=1590652 RepID=A0ABR5A5A3_9BACL|nr:SIR2 family protein [Cohnella kolymensis]KIL36212.1 hypothetical protein SD71_09705 [Cohnella kolymensis]